MGQIFVNQTNLDIEVTVQQDITGATETLIKFIKPSDKEGQFVATILDPLIGKIKYSIVDATDIDEYGEWIFWGFITFADGKKAAGEPFQLKVFEEGEIC